MPASGLRVWREKVGGINGVWRVDGRWIVMNVVGVVHVAAVVTVSDV